MKLSEHFTLDEFTSSQTATRCGINNAPPAEYMPALERTAQGMEMVREVLGDVPILVSSGYRSPELNMLVNGSHGSQHLLGEACDFTAPAFGSPEEIMRAIIKSEVPYDQLILEYYDPTRHTGWVHVSFSLRNRRQKLVIDHAGTRPWSD